MPKRKRGFTASSSNIRNPPRSRDRGSEDGNDLISVWVQCENDRCQKWRRISAEDAKDLNDSPWYCWLNRDVRFNNCSASEEKAKKPKHMKFIYSLLPLGEVVTAKMPGYPAWPGLLTYDPTCGEYYDAPLDKENEITHYHVEFFGRPRSRAWLVPALVHPLRAMSETDEAPQFRKIQGRQLAELKRSYEVALKEARRSLDMAVSERLESCHFKYFEEEDIPMISADREAEPRSTPGTDSEVTSSSPTSEVTSSSPTIPVISNKPACVSNRDVEPNLFKREKDFLISLQSFATERGMTTPKQPMWRGKRIRLFDFYNLVLTYGGFENVCRCKLWNKVYNELLKSTVVYGGMSTAARVFYQKHLMPFEHHNRSRRKVDVHFVPDEVITYSAERPGRRPSLHSRRTSSSSMNEGEQTVPEDLSAAQDSKGGAFKHDRLIDLVPSSNPDSPRRCSLGSCSFDSDDDESTALGCDMVEKELQQLERLLSSLEPSLYPQSEGNSDCDKPRYEKEQPRDTGTLPLKDVDVLKTLDEMDRIEGAIAELNSLVSIELDNL